MVSRWSTAARAAIRLRTSVVSGLRSAWSRIRLPSCDASAGRSGRSRGTGVKVLEHRIDEGEVLLRHEVDRLGVFAQHFAVGVDDVRLGIHEGAVILVSLAFAGREEGGLEFLEEGVVGPGVLVDADAQNHHALIGVFLRKAVERG